MYVCILYLEFLYLRMLFFVRSYVARLAYLSEGKKDVFKEVSIPVNEDSPLTIKVVAEVAVHIEEAREP